MLADSITKLAVLLAPRSDCEGKIYYISSAAQADRTHLNLKGVNQIDRSAPLQIDPLTSIDWNDILRSKKQASLVPKKTIPNRT